jgi:CheY-like chemotaxis protein
MNVPGIVMIADADPYTRELVSRFLSESGYKVVIAVDGYDALDTARKSPPLVILADILLPKLDGVSLCRILKDDPATQGIVTVILFSVLAAEERARKAGAEAFIKKPLEKNRVLSVVQKFSQTEGKKNE